MALLEQLVYGNPASNEPGRAVLAISEGLEDKCREEVVRLCEGWGAVPDGGPRRPVVMSFPLDSRLRELPGELFAVIRISQGLRPIFHAVVLATRDYQEFDYNPYTLAQEGVFLDEFAPGGRLDRKIVNPSSLAPLVTPPPGSADVGSVDEAVRQVLANDRLLLPLEHPISDSDRFLALVIASMPRAIRRTLRFASWAPTGTNHYTLAATYKDSAYFSSWQPYLMTTVIGQLDQACDEYLEELRDCLVAGDLAGIEQRARNARVEGRRVKRSTRRLSEQTSSAMLDPTPPRKQRKAIAATVVTGQKTPPPGKKSKRAVARVGSPHDRGHRAQPTRRGIPRRPARRGGGARRGFAIILSVAILAAGAYYLWSEGHWARLPGLPAIGSALESRTEHGVVDVGAVYRVALDGVQEGGVLGAATSDDDQRRRGLELLRQAGQLLDVQGRDYLEKSDQTLADDERDGRKPAPAEPLQKRGQVLARELRRLVLAQVSLRDRVDWQDLADLDAQALAARYDSLLARRQSPLASEPTLQDVDRLLRRLDVTTRQVKGFARLQALLGQSNWQNGWSRQVQAAVDAMGAVRQPYAQRLRDDAEVLARLKRAEHANKFQIRAYRHHYAEQPLAPPAVADILPALYRRVAETAPGRPPLVVATADLHRALEEISAGDVTIARLDELVPRLEQNLAARFDPAVYGDHLARLRFLQLELALATSAPSDSLAAVVDDEQIRESLRFLRALETGSDGEEWRALAASCEDPFLVRWATHEAELREAAARNRAEALATAQEELVAERAELLRVIQAGGRVDAAWRALVDHVTQLRSDHLTDLDARSAADPHAQSVLALASALAAPPVLELAGVTVRLEQEQLTGPIDVLVELQVGDGPPHVSDQVRLGPAAPAGTGWVGSGPTEWTVPVARASTITMSVRRLDDGRPIARFELPGWLEGTDPADLGRLDDGQGVRLNWRLATPYWSALALPEIGT